MPSSPKQPAELRRFLRRLPLTLLAAALLWLAMRPAWDETLAWVTQGLARLAEAPWATQIVVDGEHAIVGRRDMRVDSGRLSLSLTQIHFNLVPFLALVLATSGWWRRDGWQRLLASLTLAFMSHVLTLLWHVKFFFASSLGPWSHEVYSDFAREFYGTLQYFFDIPVTFTLPLLLWVGFFSPQVFAMLGIALPDTQAQPRPRKRR
jgi:hypothetical protein